MIDCDSAAALMEPLTDLVMQAGVAILAVNRKVMTIEGKLDGSPATDADFAADRIIGDGLARLVPDGRCLASSARRRSDGCGAGWSAAVPSGCGSMKPAKGGPSRSIPARST